MKSSYLNVITVALSLYFTRIAATTSRKLDSRSHSECRWNGDLLMDCSFTGKSDMPMAIPQTVTTVDLSYNSIRALSVSNTEKEDWTIKHLNLSNNRISELTFSSFMCFPSLEMLNLNDNEIHSISLVLQRHSSLLGKCPSKGFRNVFTSLKVLSIQRNHLNATPGGLWKLKSLQNLDLSSNAISQIDLTDFQNCLQLEKLYLQNNKISKIHPDAFKDLNKLQIVNLSTNAMTTILPMMFIALTLPHLDADLSNNQWQCDCNTSVFQNFISESWRKKWNSICSESISAPGLSFLSLEWLDLNCKMHMEDLISFKKVAIPHGATTLLDCDSDQPWVLGDNETYWWTPYNRMSENTQIPHISLNQMKKLVINKAERPLEGLYVCFSTSGRKKHVIYEISVKQERSPKWVRKAREILSSTREKETTPQDLTLAVCLSVIITFLCAFCLGAFARPYIDRLWQQRCQTKSSVSENAYSNEGFYDDVGITGNPKPLPESRHQDACSMSIYETTESPDLYSDIDVGTPRANKVWKDQEQRRSRAVPADRKRNENILPKNHDACSIGSEDMNVVYSDVISVKREHIDGKDILRELAKDNSFHEDSRRASSIDKSLQKDVGSFQSHSPELDLTYSREMIFPSPQMSMCPKAQSFRESVEIDEVAHLPSEVRGAQKEFPKEMQLSSHLHPPNIQQQTLSRSNSGSQYEVNENGTVLSDDPRDFNHPSLLPNWENVLDVDHPQHNLTPSSFSDHQNTKNINNEDILTDNSYESDEGSLFTLSSTDSEYDWKNIQEQPHSERDQVATWPSMEENCIIKGSSNRMDNIQSESPEDNASIQKTLEKCETEKKEHSENIISRPDINLSETDLPTYQMSSSSKTRTQEYSPSSLASSPVSVEIPGTFIYDHVLTRGPEPSEWHHSWEKQERVPIANFSPQQTPFGYPGIPSDSENSDFKEMDTQIHEYDTHMQIADTIRKETLPEINPEEKMKSSQQSFEGNDIELNVIDSIDRKKDLLFPSMDSGSTWITIQAQSPQSVASSDEHSFQSERQEEHFEAYTKKQVPLQQQKLTNKDKTSLLRIQKDFSDNHWGQYSEEDMLELDKNYPNFCTNEPQLQRLIDPSVGSDGNSDPQNDNKREEGN
ncbi:leucine-rich repeat-containing protein 66 [Phascolarctos cinereus]|uniref:Leucine-rich repeat-containing protein 66 n=1 Tax=Phascolarctos cinereus TaxID=38626 RepID=A0A6P5KLM9_PHACI|nr:leucine-rich repeat-containing protein 66 [Phascolarctos cinereus]